MEDYRCWNKHGEEGLNEAEMRNSYLERDVSTVVNDHDDDVNEPDILGFTDDDIEFQVHNIDEMIRNVERHGDDDQYSNGEYMQWLRSQNEFDHYLDNTGYAGKQRRWQQEDERLAQLSLQNPYDNFRGLGPFMRACSKLTESGDVNFYSQSTVDVAQMALRESNKDSNGDRKNDALSKALQTKE
jgi:hypothetical protein